MSTTITKGVPTESGSLRVELFSGGTNRGMMVNIIHNEDKPITMTLKTFNRFLYDCDMVLFLKRYGMKHEDNHFGPSNES
jgi:hypothetical protein